jgi:predicted nucleotidyltransferase
MNPRVVFDTNVVVSALLLYVPRIFSYGGLDGSMNTTQSEIITRIKNRLMQIHPHRVILFGSHAWGTPDEESDIDLVVVLEDETAPSTFSEKMKNVLKVRKCVADINREVSLDLLVYSKPEWRKFIETGSYFSREISEKGQELI